MCLKIIREDDTKVTNLTYKQIFKLCVNISRDNDKLENSIIYFKEHFNFFENRNKVLGEEIANITNETLKSEKM